MFTNISYKFTFNDIKIEVGLQREPTSQHKGYWTIYNFNK